MRNAPAISGALIVLLWVAGAACAEDAAAPPERVMSLNVCTDQLAMLLAAPGQLMSVSELARDPGLSFNWKEAAAYPANKGLAEEVIAAKPDLVVTGQFSLHNTTLLLRRLGYRIEEFTYTQTVETIPGELRRMGQLLGASERAEAMAQSFEGDLAAIRDRKCETPVTAIAYEQNGIASGSGTLIDSAMQSAGVTNLAATMGFSGMASFPLELLVKNAPQIIILPDALSDAPSLADQIATHPALASLAGRALEIHLPRGSTACGGPFVIEAVKALAVARDKVSQCRRQVGQ
ncbi:MAG: ABC transporter substrate-binding protein [Mesorhizobium sp.]